MKLVKRAILFVSIFAGTIAIFYLPYREIRTKTIESIRNEQYVVTLQASRGIERFFEHYGNLLSYFSTLPSITNFDQPGKLIMQNLFINHSKDLLAVTRIDEDGKIIYTVPFDSTAIGKDVSYQTHNAKIIRTHQPVVSDVFTAVQGYKAVAYAYPVFKGNAYRGSLSILIPFKRLAVEHLSGVGFGKDGFSWIFSKGGTIIYGPDEDSIGMNAKEYFGESDSFVSFIEKVLNEESGRGFFTESSKEDNSKKETFLGFFAPSRLPQNTWYTVIAAPKEELYASLDAFRDKWLVIFTLMLTAAFIVSYYLIEARKILKEERKRRAAEEALRESEEKYRELTELAPQTVFETDASGRITYLNRFGFKMSAFGEEDLAAGIKLKDLCRDGCNDLNVKDLIHADGACGRVKVTECNLFKKDGTEFPAIIYSSPVIRNGVLSGLRGIIIDITERKQAEVERKRLETELMHAHKMEALGRFAGGIAHDFNNILSAVIGYTDLSLMNLEDPKYIEDNLNEVSKAARRAKELVQQIMTFSRKTNQEFVPVKLNEVIEEALKILRPSIPESVEISTELEKEPVTVLANPTQIHQVLFNLCSNAIHAMNDRGKLEIILRNVEFKECQMVGAKEIGPGRFAELIIADTGVGMDSEIQKRIFEPFFTTKEVGKGVGMGLSVVHGIINSHDGAIKVHSEVGRGTSFYIYFPEASISKVDYSMPQDEVPVGSERILFVDDEPSLADIGKRMLEELGYKVTSVTDSRKALEIFLSAPDNYDLLITDQVMPVLTGCELVLEIRKIRGGFPAVICSGYSEVLSKEKLSALGDCELIMKPINVKKIARVVRKVLDESVKVADS